MQVEGIKHETYFAVARPSSWNLNATVLDGKYETKQWALDEQAIRGGRVVRVKSRIQWTLAEDEPCKPARKEKS